MKYVPRLVPILFVLTSFAAAPHPVHAGRAPEPGPIGSPPAVPTATSAVRLQVVRNVEVIKAADYQGDRAELANRYELLKPFAGNSDAKFASRVHYWRGFAMWRSAINGFNDGVARADLEQDLTRGLESFRAALGRDSGFVDAKLGAASCLGYLMFASQGDTARLHELSAQTLPLLAAVRGEAATNPRVDWVMGPVYWNTPADRGGGQDVAIQHYQKALELARAQKAGAVPLPGESAGSVVHDDPLEPSWGEPELLMSLAWSQLNKAKPDPAAAEANARAALELVPDWHYVKDILLPQILKAKGTGARK